MSKSVRESVAAYGSARRDWTVSEYYRAYFAGEFGENAHVELLRGEVVFLSPQKSLHALATENVLVALRTVFPSASIRIQMPLGLDDRSEPEPDVLVAIGPRTRYAKQHPSGNDTLLVVEVADTSITQDRGFKARLYAEYGVPEYWILNIKGKRLEILREPRAGRYTVSEVVVRDGKARPIHAEAPGEVLVSELLPEST